MYTRCLFRSPRHLAQSCSPEDRNGGKVILHSAQILPPGSANRRGAFTAHEVEHTGIFAFCSPRARFYKSCHLCLGRNCPQGVISTENKLDVSRRAEDIPIYIPKLCGNFEFRRTCARISPDVVEPFRSWLPFFCPRVSPGDGLNAFLESDSTLAQ